ncbi:hypothetical protein BT96DRAFT_950615 [Gymnopus androsaceus JB14]|uniref:Uncharacterized protein n=1 Tax=Gymnopus androsaceus JB14 TaxID=1447944 RepID=A0A6A4GFX6_9AGAR|nr:hypothetical protein BT96DRAFT_950615 [Gymnopus androsaceus JB14]
MATGSYKDVQIVESLGTARRIARKATGANIGNIVIIFAPELSVDFFKYANVDRARRFYTSPTIQSALERNPGFLLGKVAIFDFRGYPPAVSVPSHVQYRANIKEGDIYSAKNYEKIIEQSRTEDVMFSIQGIFPGEQDFSRLARMVKHMVKTVSKHQQIYREYTTTTNFTQFCTDVDECDGIADWLSWPTRAVVKLQVSSPCHWNTTFPTDAGTTSEPKIYKPEFFDNLKKEKEAWEGVWDVRSWIVDQGAESGWNLGAWTPRAIATDLWGVLRARDATSFGSGSAEQQVPPRHRTFSSLKFVYPKANMKSAGREQLGETDDGEPYSGGAIVLEEQQEMGIDSKKITSNNTKSKGKVIVASEPAFEKDGGLKEYLAAPNCFPANVSWYRTRICSNSPMPAPNSSSHGMYTNFQSARMYNSFWSSRKTNPVTFQASFLPVVEPKYPTVKDGERRKSESMERKRMLEMT